MVPVPTSTPTLIAADAWQATLARLDAVWQTNWPMSIQILDSYLQQFPDQQPAMDKLYAALVEYGGALIDPEAPTRELPANARRLSHLVVRKPRTPWTHSPPLLDHSQLTPASLPTSTPVAKATTAPGATASPDSGHATALPSPTPVRSPAQYPGRSPSRQWWSDRRADANSVQSLDINSRDRPNACDWWGNRHSDGNPRPQCDSNSGHAADSCNYECDRHHSRGALAAVIQESPGG